MPAQAEVNRFVFDSLRHGPAEVETLYSAAFKWGRAPRGMVNGALIHFKVRRLVRPEDDGKFVALTVNLAAIWWARRAQPQPYGMHTFQGSHPDHPGFAA